MNPGIEKHMEYRYNNPVRNLSYPERKKMEEGKEFWENKHFSFYQNKDCEFFPCHAGADPESFNCLFCYCPLYALGTKCGGNFKITKTGVKDCTGCLIPHMKKNYGYVTGKFHEIIEIVKQSYSGEESNT